jgi:regulator of protease activity HflC (stomatin/prohibitin superfamily)
MHPAKTQLVQVNISNPEDAITAFNQATATEIPIVAVPDERLPCSCFYLVPSGAYSIVHTCGRDENPEGIAELGLRCAPYWTHVAYMVTQQSCTYNAPVKACPTSDDVTVDCELTLVFSIGPGADDVKNFVYNLGALKFNEFLAAETEEAMRQLMRATALEDVYELRGSGSEHVANVLKILNDKFNPFGVTFVKAAITDVMLNDELRGILQGTTEFRTKITELEKEDDFHLKNIGFDFTKKMDEKERVYERSRQDINNDIAVALVNREQKIVESESRREVAVTRAEEAAQVGKKRAEADFDVAEKKAQRENADLMSTIKSDVESKRIHIDHDYTVRVTESEGLIKVAASQAEALKVEAKAEGEAAASLKIIREHNLEMARLEVTEAIARRSKLVISGASGEALIKSIVDTTLLGDIKM